MKLYVHTVNKDGFLFFFLHVRRSRTLCFHLPPNIGCLKQTAGALDGLNAAQQREFKCSSVNILF